MYYGKPDKLYIYSSPSDSEEDETDNQSPMSNYGAEDHNDKYFTKKGAQRVIKNRIKVKNLNMAVMT